GEARQPRGGEGGGPQGVFRAHTGGPQRGRNQGKQPEGEGEAARQSKGAGGSAIGARLLWLSAIKVVPGGGHAAGGLLHEAVDEPGEGEEQPPEDHEVHVTCGRQGLGGDPDDQVARGGDEDSGDAQCAHRGRTSGCALSPALSRAGRCGFLVPESLSSRRPSAGPAGSRAGRPASSPTGG